MIGDGTGPYRIGWAAVSRLPAWPARALFFLIAEVVWRRQTSGVVQLRANLAQVTGAAPDSAEVRRLARLGVRSYVRYWREFFQLSGARPPVTFEGLDRLPVAGSGRGAILALPHSGNWDLAGAALAELGHPITTVGQRLRPEALYQRFVAARAAVGIEVLPVDEPRRTVPALGRRLAEGGVVCLLADRDVTGAGLPVRLHGRATTMPAGPARLALSTGAALIPVSLWYSGRGLRVHLHEEIVASPAAGRRAQATAMTQALADVFTDAIRRHPQDWHVLQPVWPPVADLDRPAAAAVEPPTADLDRPATVAVEPPTADLDRPATVAVDLPWPAIAYDFASTLAAPLPWRRSRRPRSATEKAVADTV